MGLIMAAPVHFGDTQFLEEIRKRHSVTVKQLTAAIGITENAVRHRLNRYQKMGLVERQEIRGKRGRPSHSYALTGKAGKFFGSQYTDLAIALWNQVKELEYEDVRNQLMQRIERELVERYRNDLSGDADIGQRLLRFQQSMADRGIAIEIDERGEYPVMREHDCPYAELATRDRSICEIESRVFQELLQIPVHISQCRFDGCDYCEFQMKPDTNYIDSDTLIPIS